MRWLTAFILVLVLCVTLGFFAMLWGAYRVAHVVVPNAYAVEWVSSLVIQHLKHNADTWPRGWHDLADDYERVGCPWSFGELKDRVDVNWQADPRELAHVIAQPGRPPFRVIWLRDGSTTHWTSAEPNQLIRDYLQRVSEQSAVVNPDVDSGTEGDPMR